MKSSDWFRRVVQSLEFGAGFELFFLLGPGELAVAGLQRVAEELQRFGPARWHRLDVEGFDALIAEPAPGLLHFVHGFEFLSPEAARRLAAQLNLNRDRMRGIGAPVFVWIPEDFYEEFFRQAPDLVSWRSQVDVVPVSDFRVD